MSDGPVGSTPERESRIRELAYQLWEVAGRPEGHDREFWEQAETQINSGD